MVKISSNSTVIAKRITPILSFGLLGFILLVSLLHPRNGPQPDPALAIPLAMGAIGYFLMRCLAFDLMDEVYDNGDSLIVRNAGLEEIIPLRNIENVRSSLQNRPPRITISLKQPCQFGKEVSFFPPRTFVLFGQHPLAVDLLKRAKAQEQVGT